MKMVKTKLALGAAIAALALSGTAANAAVTFSSIPYTTSTSQLGANEVMVENFDDVSLGLGTNIQESSVLLPNVAGLPPGDVGTEFGYVTQANSPGSYLLPFLANTLSIYIGSIDSYNTIKFFNGAVEVGSFTGGDLTNPANGNQFGDQTNRRYFFNFHGQDVNRVEFQTGQNSFEFDNIAASAVPEPGVWALMIAGFGMLGAALRRRREGAALLA